MPIWSEQSLNVHTWMLQGLQSLTRAETLLLGDVLLQLGICIVMLPAYRKQVAAVLAIYEANPPRVGCPVLDAAPFRLFMRRYIERCWYNMMASLATILSITSYLSMDAARVEAESHFVLQALAVLSMINLLSGLLLSVLYIDTLTKVSDSYSNTLTWVEDARAMDNSWLSMPALLGSPFTTTASGIVTFLVYRVASAAISLIGPDVQNNSGNGIEQYMAMMVVAYMILVVGQTAVTARAFLRTKAPEVVIAPGTEMSLVVR